MAGSESLPRWDLDPIYPGFDSPEYKKDKEELARISERILAHMSGSPEGGGFADWLREALKLESAAGALAETLGSYAYTRYSTATTDRAALAELNSLEEMNLPLKRAGVLFRNIVAARKADVEALISSAPDIAEYAFHLREETCGLPSR
jgi:oligoendopeptidase F